MQKVLQHPTQISQLPNAAQEPEVLQCADWEQKQMWRSAPLAPTRRWSHMTIGQIWTNAKSRKEPEDTAEETSPGQKTKTK